MTERFLADEGVESRVRLRAVEPADADAMWRVETDSSQWRLSGLAAPYSHIHILDYATSYEADPFKAGQLRLIVDFNGQVAGIADLYDISAKNRTAFVGIYIFEEHRGKNLASKSLKLLEEYAFNILNLRILAAKVAESNTDSVHLFEAAEFVRSGKLSNWILSGNQTHNLILFEKELSYSTFLPES